jgi:hypothetical protein
MRATRRVEAMREGLKIISSSDFAALGSVLQKYTDLKEQERAK